MTAKAAQGAEVALDENAFTFRFRLKYSLQLIYLLCFLCNMFFSIDQRALDQESTPIGVVMRNATPDDKYSCNKMKNLNPSSKTVNFVDSGVGSNYQDITTRR